MAAYAFWCWSHILSSKIAPGGNGVYKRRKEKNSCIGKKSRNGVLTFRKVAERRSGALLLNLSTG